MIIWVNNNVQLLTKHFLNMAKQKIRVVLVTRPAELFDCQITDPTNFYRYKRNTF